MLSDRKREREDDHGKRDHHLPVEGFCVEEEPDIGSGDVDDEEFNEHDVSDNQSRELMYRKLSLLHTVDTDDDTPYQHCVPKHSERSSVEESA